MSKTCLTSDYSSHNKRIRDLSYCNHLCYCEQHGYDLIEFKCPYNPHLNIDRMLSLLDKYEFVVNIGTDVIIQKSEIGIPDLCKGPEVKYKKNGVLTCYPEGIIPPCVACKEYFGSVINGDFVILHKCSEAYDFLKWLKNNQEKTYDSQSWLTRLYNEGHRWFGENPKIQIAAPSINKHKNFSGVNVSDYFSIHFHTLGIHPDVDTKYKGMTEFLEKHPEYT